MSHELRVRWLTWRLGTYVAVSREDAVVGSLCMVVCDRCGDSEVSPSVGGDLDHLVNALSLRFNVKDCDTAVAWKVLSS